MVAANEDEYNPFSKMWFNPPTKERYGSVCFGHPDLQAQAAMNEHGLFYDFTAQEGIDPSKFNLKNPYYGDLFFEILGKCKNVKEALAYLKTRDYTFNSQALLADAEGRSVIINAGAIVEKTGNYQINTNFNISKLASKDYTCRRYDIANEMLAKADKISVPLFKDILARTRQEGNLSTQYSNIYDLKRGLIYVYSFHNFEQVYIIDLKKELKKGYRLENVADHFPTSFAYESFVKSHAEYPRELLLSEIDKNGIDKTLAHYQALKDKQTPKGKDSINTLLIDAGIMLVRKSYNRHFNGEWWSYFFKFPGSYKIWHSQDNQIQAALKIWQSILQDNKTPGPMLLELYAYINLVAGKKEVTKEYYEKAIAMAPTGSDTSTRGRKMLEDVGCCL